MTDYRRQSAGRRDMQAWGPAVLILAAGQILAWAWHWTGAEGWWFPMLAGSGLSAAWLWRALDWPDGDWGRYLSLGGLVLIACMLGRVLYAADYLLLERTLWPFFTDDVVAPVIKGELATMVGLLLTLAAWRVAGGASWSPATLMQAPRAQVRRLLIVVYVAALVSIAALELLPTQSRAMGQLLPSVQALGSGATLFLPLLLTRRTGLRLVLVVLLGIPFFYSALGTGMKENILLALLPAGFLLWNAVRNRALRVVLIVPAVLLLGLVTAFIGHYREQVWFGDSDANQAQMVGDFAAGIRQQGVLSAVQRGNEEFLARGNAAEARGWTMSVADSDGWQPDLVFAPLAYVLVPRVVWPGKPEIRQGWEFSGLVFGDSYIEWSDSSLSAGLYPSFYLGGGWWALVVASILLGWLLAGMTRLALRLGGPTLTGLYLLALAPYALRLDEAWSVGALSAPVVTLVYVGLVFAAAQAAGWLLPRARPVNA